MRMVTLFLRHVAAVVPDLAAPRKLFETLGFQAPLPELNEPVGALELDVACGPVPLKIFKPTVPEGPHGRWLARNGPGLQHVLLDVSDLPGTLRRLAEQGVRLGEMEEEAEGRFAWVHPEQTFGALIRLAEVWGRTGPCRSRPGSPVLGHIGWALPDLKEAKAFLKKLGLKIGRTEPDTPVFAAEQAVIDLDPAELSLKAPAGPGPFERFLAKHGPGLHHLMFEVADLSETAERVRAAGFRLLPDAPIEERHQWTWFVHPRDAQGILVELGQPLRR